MRAEELRAHHRLPVNPARASMTVPVIEARNAYQRIFPCDTPTEAWPELERHGDERGAVVR